MNGWTSMAQRVAAYLEARRALGYELRVEGEQLQRFARFADQRSLQGPLTVELALAWASASRSPSRLGPARRLEVLRPFAKYCALFEPDTEIPPARLLGSAHRRLTPHIYSDQEIAALLEATHTLGPADGLRPATMRCLLGLLAATGLRVSEALHLQRTDVDLDQGLLTIRETKFRKSRYVPIHPTTREALAAYAQVRDRLVPSAWEPAFFLLDNGWGIQYRQAYYAFCCLRAQLGWAPSPHGAAPRLYDLRHYSEFRIIPSKLMKSGGALALKLIGLGIIRGCSGKTAVGHGV